MRLRELLDVPPSRRRERDALGALVIGFAEFILTSASRGFRVLVSSNVWVTGRARQEIEAEEGTGGITRPGVVFSWVGG